MRKVNLYGNFKARVCRASLTIMILCEREILNFATIVYRS